MNGHHVAAIFDFIGGAMAVLLFAITGNALSFATAGVGVALGLILGAGWEQSQKARER